ncbi:MAG: AsmA family protein [Candidatus Accumulibacter sp.]|nr:AsmA family protein [Accumulibacter sp.]
MASIDTPRIRRRWPVYVLLVLVGLVVAAVGAISWLLLDTNRLRSALEEGISKLSDRPFLIDGEFDISPGRVTTFRGTNIRWLNPAWSEQPDMLTVRKLSFSVDLWSVIRGPIVIESAQAEDASLLFEWNEEGQFNWQMAGKDARTDKPDERSNPLHLLLGQTELRNVEIRVRHPGLTDELRVDVEQASQQHDAQDMLVVASSVSVGGREIAVRGRVGPFAELIAGGAIDYQADLVGANGSLAAKGHFDRLRAPIAPSLELTAVAADAEEILKALAIRPVTRGKVQLQARIAPAGDRLASSVKGNFGEFNIDAGLASKSVTSFGEFSLALSSDGPRVGALARLAGIDHLPDASYTLHVDANRDGQSLQVKQLSFSSDGISLEASGVAHKLPELRDLDVDIALRAGSAQTIGKLFALASLPALPLDIKATIKSKGGGHKDALRARFALGNIEGELSGDLSEERDFAGSTFSYRGRSPDLRELARSRGITLPAVVPAGLEVDLELLPERLHVKRLVANVDDNQLAASGMIDFGLAGTVFAFDPRMTGSDLGSLARVFLGNEKAGYFPGGSYELTARLALKGKRLTISSGDARAGSNLLGFDGSVDFAGEIPKVDGKITAKGTSLAELIKPEIAKGVPVAAYSLSSALRVSEQGVALDDLQFSLADSSLSGRLSSGWPGKPEQVGFDLTAAGSNLRAVLPEFPGYVAAPVAFRIEARGRSDPTGINIEALKGKLADAGVDMAGKLILKPSFSADGLRLSVSGPKLSDLGRVKAWPLADLPFAVSTTMTGSENRLSMDDLQLTLGDSDLKGSVRIDTQTRPDIDLNVRSDYLHLDQLLAHRTVATGETGEASGISQTTPDGKRKKLFSDNALRFEALRDFDGTLMASVTNVDSEHRQLRNVRANATLKDGLLVVKQLQADEHSGTLKAGFSVDSRDKQLLVKGDLQGSDVVFAIRGMSKEDHDQLPHLDLNSSFSASGNSISGLAAGLSGYFWLHASKGSFPSMEVGALYGDFASLLISTLNPFVKKDPYSKLSCGGIYLEANKGRVATAPAVVMQTDKLSIVAKGTIDLRSEAIDFAFKTTPLRGVGLSAGDIINPFIKLAGTLQAPVLRLDVQNAAIEGGVAAATAGMSILATSLWDRWIGSSDACEKVREEARKIRNRAGKAG